MITIDSSDWLRLERQSVPPGQMNGVEVVTSPSAFLAVGPGNERHVLFPLEAPADAFEDSRSRGLTVRAHVLNFEGQAPGWYIDVVCTEPHSYEAFDMVASEMLTMHETQKAPAAVRATLSKWRKFWGLPASEGLTGERVIGLFSELWFLAVWLLPLGSKAVQAWVSPSGAGQDFQWRETAVEVKGTTSAAGHVHRIHGIDQLVPPDGASLYLFSLCLHEDDRSDNSLLSLVQSIADQLEPEGYLDIFEAKLAMCGYSPIHRRLYEGCRFRVAGEKLYRVEKPFPALTPASFVGGVPAGVGSIDYDVNLGICPELCVADNPGDAQSILAFLPDVP